MHGLIFIVPLWAFPNCRCYISHRILERTLCIGRNHSWLLAHHYWPRWPYTCICTCTQYHCHKLTCRQEHPMPKPIQSMYMWSVRPILAAVPSSLATVSLNGLGVLVSLNTGEQTIHVHTHNNIVYVNTCIMYIILKVTIMFNYCKVNTTCIIYWCYQCTMNTYMYMYIHNYLVC